MRALLTKRPLLSKRAFLTGTGQMPLLSGRLSAAGGGHPSAYWSQREVRALAPLTRNTPFKRAFVNDDSKDTLRHLLSAVFDDITDCEAAVASSNEDLRSFLGHLTIFDVRCKLSTNETVIIRLQKANRRPEIADRLIGYQACGYHEQWEQSEKGHELIPVRVLALLDFTIQHDLAICGSLVQRYYMQPAAGTDPSLALANRFGRLGDFTVVQLPLAPTKEQLTEASTPIEKWAHLLRYSGEYNMETLPLPLLQDPYKKAIDSARYDMMPKEEREALFAEEECTRQYMAANADEIRGREAAERRAEEYQKQAEEYKKRTFEYNKRAEEYNKQGEEDNKQFNIKYIPNSNQIS